MEQIEAQQISCDELEKIQFDLFILALGYEKRSVYLVEKYNISTNHKIAVAHLGKQRLLNRKKNEIFIRNNNFEIIHASGEETFPIDIILNIIKKDENAVVKILIDYSCMTKVWYAGIINTITSLSFKCRKMEIYFSYTPAEFNALRRQKRARFINSVVHEGQKKLSAAKPVALIIGLGLNNLRAEMLINSIKPAVIYYLYADPANNIKYVQRVLRNNQEIIASSEIRNLYCYPLNDLNKINNILTCLCLDLRLKYKIIIAPFGPKVFSLISILIANRYPDLDVWRVSSGPDEPAIDRIPEGDPLIYKVDFAHDDTYAND